MEIANVVNYILIIVVLVIAIIIILTISFKRKVESFNDFKDKISVIIPTYNRFQYLLNAIDSVKQQTYKNLEIIVKKNDPLKNNEIEKVSFKYKK